MGADAFRQLNLLSNEAYDVEYELAKLDELVEEYAVPKDIVMIRAKRPVEYGDFDYLPTLQKQIYHLSLIGVVDDWTVDWKIYAVMKGS